MKKKNKIKYSIKNKKYRILGVLAVIFFQLFILIFEYGSTIYPIWFGKEIALKTEPIDPRSMFRGNYARLHYNISTIPYKSIDVHHTPKNGDIVFVILEKGKNSIYSYKDTSFKKPERGVFIRGRITAPHSKKVLKKYNVKYGIEAFFAPKDKAIQIEQMLKDNAIARVKIASNGKAVLIDVVKKE